MDGIPDSVLAQTPAMGAPIGDVNNFVNPPDLFVLSVVVASTSLAVAVFFYSIRLFVKWYLVRKLYPEDYTCGLSVAVFAALSADVTIAALQGSTRHQWNLNLLQAIPISYTAYWGEIIFCVAICLAKISVIQQIRRIFATQKKGALHKTCTLLMWVNGCFYTAASLAGIFSCTPRRAAWDPFTTGNCINKMLLIVTSSGINVLSDIVILVIPMWCVWHLVLPLKKKLPLVAVFLTGIFSLSMAVLKLYITVPLLTTEDLTYTLNLTGLSACAETSSAILIGCLPCLPRFVQYLRKSSTQSLSSGRSPTLWSNFSQRKKSSKFSSSGFSYDSVDLEKTVTMNQAATVPVARAEEGSPITPIDNAICRPPTVAYTTTSRGGDERITALPPLPPLATSFSRGHPEGHTHHPTASFDRSSDTTLSPLSGETAVMGSDRVGTYIAPSPPTPPLATLPLSNESNHDLRETAAVQRSMQDTSPPARPRQARRERLTELANSPVSQRTLNALTSKYWQDLDESRR